MKIVTSDQMRQIDRECIRRGTPGHVLMENAGRAVAEEARRILEPINQKQFLFLVGPGNNGGDGLVAARYLHDWEAEVSVYLCSPRPKDDTNLELVQQRNMSCIDAAQDKELTRFSELLASADCVIDALFGTGKARPIQGVLAQVLDKVTQVKKKKPAPVLIAIDLPSGLNADTGEVDPVCPLADYTVTLALPKLGLFRFPGAERVGELSIADIGIPAELAADIAIELITGEWAGDALPKRPLDANKGTFGRVLVVAGSVNYIGAAYLACSGALRAGAGLVTLATASSLQPVLAAKLTETTYLPLPEANTGIIAKEAAALINKNLKSYDVLLLGCGLGQSDSVSELISSLLFQKNLPLLVLDADALNTLARIPRWWQKLAGDAILTPHPGEMSGLSGLTIAEIQSDRVGVARKYAREWQKTIVLKGAFTVIASPDGNCRISPFANPGLASGGTGDVLAGAIAGLVPQGLSLFDAASLGVYLHGKAGELVKDTLGDTGMLASDLLPVLPGVIKQLREMTKNRQPLCCRI
ncbi:MAG: NAD(P)H-hydrate dehydratase [Dehalococcoidales bacterium]|nr:NAD(P)H-hydrate dehydratase [Dehalococcoidales bacterium]